MAPALTIARSANPTPPPTSMHRHDVYALSGLRDVPRRGCRIQGVRYTLPPRGRYAHLAAAPPLMADVIVDLGGDFRLSCAVLRSPSGPVLALPHEAVDAATGRRVAVASDLSLAAEILDAAARIGREGLA